MRAIFKIFQDIFEIPDLRRRIMITFGLLAIYRLGFHIVLPGVDARGLAELASQKGSGGFLDLIGNVSALTGGNLQQATVFSLGIMPYISASIIFSLMVKVFPKLEALSKEGESGRQAIGRYTRYATVLLCVIQSFLVLSFLQTAKTQYGDLALEGWYWAPTQIVIMTAGTMFLLWLGEKITEKGIGNGTSLIIMAGIIAQLPGVSAEMVSAIIDASPQDKPFKVLQLVGLAATFFGIVLAVVFITKGQRRIPIQQARTVKGQQSAGGQRHYMPIRVNSAGVLPIIFAQSLIMIPTALLQLSDSLRGLSDWMAPGGFIYLSLYVLMICFFTYFWTSLMFNPVEIADQMKDYGSFIPGIRPGRRTAEYLQQIINRITLTGAVFLAIIAITPQFIQSSLQVNAVAAYMLGGTGILIVVGVALDLVDKIEAQMLVRQYEGFVATDETGGSESGDNKTEKSEAR